MSIRDLIRPDLRDFSAYAAADANPDLVRLHANESPWAPLELIDDINRYPDPQPRALLATLADFYRVGTAQVLATRGSDDGIDLLVRCFCRGGEDEIIVCPPTFGMYEIAARIQGAGIRRVPLDADTGFTPDSEGIARSARACTRLVFLCSPNNPTGNLIDPESLAFLCTTLRHRALVVVDEAYIEFSDAPSAAGLLNEFENLVVLRTLSKAFGLAGARCGALLAGEDVIAAVRKLMPPYPLSRPTIALAMRALSDAGRRQVDERVRIIRRERVRVANALRKLISVSCVWPSEANFLLVRTLDAPRVLQACRDQEILIRDVGAQPGLAGCVRVTIGTPEQNDRLMQAVGEAA